MRPFSFAALSGRLRTIGLVAVILAHPGTAGAQPLPAEVSHWVFVTGQDKPTVTLIDDRTDRTVGTLDLGLVPAQVMISPALPRLVATDGQARGFVLADLGVGQTRFVPLDFPARRLFLSDDGLKAGVSDLADGNLALFDLSDGHRIARFAGLPRLRDVAFGSDGKTLTIAAEGLQGLGLFGLASGTLATDIPLPRPFPGGLAAFTKAPNGRQAFARPAAGGPIEVVDLKGAKSLAEIDAGPGSLTATPSGTGAYFLVANETAASFSIIHGEDFKLGAVLAAQHGHAAIYSGWFDSVAFLSSSDEARLLVFDLWRLAKGGDIALPSPPGPGTVTADGSKLYLPLAASRQVAVIDIRHRRLAGLIAVETPPAAVAVAGGYGICH